MNSVEKIGYWWAQWVLWLMGWELPDKDRDELRSYRKVIVTFPHTSIWDGVIGWLFVSAYMRGCGVRMLMLDWYFRWFSGSALKWFGFIPVNNKVANGTVNRIANVLKKEEQFLLILAAEGTRKPKRLRTGVHYLASELKVPIAIVNFDYEKHQIRRVCDFEPSENVEENLEKIKEAFGAYPPKHPMRTTYATHYGDQNYPVISMLRKLIVGCFCLGVGLAIGY